MQPFRFIQRRRMNPRWLEGFTSGKLTGIGMSVPPYAIFLANGYRALNSKGFTRGWGFVGCVLLFWWGYSGDAGDAGDAGLEDSWYPSVGGYKLK